MQKLEQLYSGKTKTAFTTDDPKSLVLEFRNDTTAFNAQKFEKLAGKGKVNNYFNAFFMEKLAEQGIETAFEKRISENESLVKRLDMLPVEAVVRNIATGSLCKRLGIKDGLELSPPLFEFFYKDDALGDPLINHHHILAFGWGTQEEIKQMEDTSLAINKILTPMFDQAGLILVDYKLEFGRFDGKLLLGDEFTPDGCRIWDKETKAILDKDRFRKGLGDVVEGYQQAAKRFGIELEEA